MEPEYKFSFNNDKKRRAAARIYLALHKKWLLFILKTLFSTALIAVVILFLGEIFLLDLPIFLLFIVTVTGVLAYIVNVFIEIYLPTFENTIKGENIDIYSVLDFESAVLFSTSDFNTPDIKKIYDGLLKTKKVKFVLNELAISQEHLAKIISSLPTTPGEMQLLNYIFEHALEPVLATNAKTVTSADLFWGYLRNSKAYEEILISLEINEKDVRNVIIWADSLFYRTEHPKTITDKLYVNKGGIADNWSAGYTLDLDRFSTDLNAGVNFDSFSIGDREGLMARIEEILSRDAKDNCLLVGPLGVGKSTIVSELAKRIFWGESAEEISHFRVVKLNIASIVSVASGGAELQRIIVNCLNDAAMAGNVVLFIDDIHNLFSGSKEGTTDVSEVFIPYLERSRGKIIGTTTDMCFQTYLESKPGIAGNFEKVNIETANEEETIRILEDLSLYYSYKYKLQIAYSALKEIYRISERYPSEKELPAKAIDLFDQACVAAKNAKKFFLTKEVIDSVVQKITNIPLAEANAEEKQKLLNLEEAIHSRVIGQEKAVTAVANALKRVRANVTNSKRPIGSFLFLGPTGVGKTELAKALAWAYFGDEEAMIRMDMSEYQDVDALARFIGKKRSGAEELEGGDFIKKVREKPFSLILLDEIEKAKSNVLDLFLQVLDEGFITDGMGRRVSLSNNIIIATSNAGANIIRKGVVENKGFEDLEKEVFEHLQESGTYRPEFLNRFDGIILFKPLTPENLLAIARLMAAKIQKEFLEKGYKIQITDEALVKISEEGYQPELGARPMRRVFQERLENYLADEILNGRLVKNTENTINISDLYGQKTLEG